MVAVFGTSDRQPRAEGVLGMLLGRMGGAAPGSAEGNPKVMARHLRVPSDLGAHAASRSTHRARLIVLAGLAWQWQRGRHKRVR
jgi:hypothetical protein